MFHDAKISIKFHTYIDITNAGYLPRNLETVVTVKSFRIFPTGHLDVVEFPVVCLGGVINDLQNTSRALLNREIGRVATEAGADPLEELA